MERVRAELVMKYEREPSVEEIAAALGISPEETLALRTAGRQPLSLEEPHGDGEERGLVDLMSRNTEVDPDAELDGQLLRDRLREVMRSLPTRDREVIEMRFGLRDGQPRTLEEVAQHYGITRERIRQIESRGLSKLREASRHARLAEFVERN
jgi:RNA polymerase primary sigma factor